MKSILQSLLWPMALGSLMLVGGMPQIATARSYKKMWKSVMAADQKDLPRTALQQVDRIAQKAQAEGRTAQWLSARVVRQRLLRSISADSARADLFLLERQVESLPSAAARQVGHAALGQLFLQQNADTAMQAAAMRHLALAIASLDTLSDTPAADYAPLWEEQHPDAAYGKSMLPVVSAIVLDAWLQQGRTALCQQLYGQLAALYTAQGMRGAALLTRLDSLNISPLQQSEKPLLQAWATTYANVPQNVETYLRWAEEVEKEDQVVAMTDTLRAAYERYRKQNPRAAELLNVVRRWERPRFQCTFGQTPLYPAARHTCTVSAYNTRQVTVRFYPLALSAAALDGRDIKDWKPYMAQRPVVELTFRFDTDRPAAERQSSTQSFTAPASGIYRVVTTDGEGRTSTDNVRISSLYAFALGDEKGCRMAIVDALTGHPVPNASLQRYRRDEGRLGWVETLRPDVEGYVHIDTVSARYRDVYYPVTASDSAGAAIMPTNNAYARAQLGNSRQHLHTLMTDRAVYRPGQEVKYALVAYRRQDEQFAVTPGQRVTVDLLDANRKCLKTDTLTTDEMGHAQGTFVLPANGVLTGRFQLRTSQTATSFLLEAYKRPTFTVTLQPVETAYRAGDTLHIQGRAATYDLRPVASARVAFDVKRFTLPWAGRIIIGRHSGGQTLQSGQALTDADGRFGFDIILTTDPEAPNEAGPQPFIGWRTGYQLTATVTAPDGESQSDEATYYTARRSAMLTADWPQMLDGDRLPSITYRQLNASGRNLPGRGKYAYVSLSGERFAGGDFETGKAFVPSLPAHLSSGRYAVVAWLEQKPGCPTDTALCSTDSVTLFRDADCHVPDRRQPLFFLSRKSAQNDSATVFIGSPRRASVFYALQVRGKIIESRLLQLSDSVVRLPLAYRPEYGSDGARLLVAMVDRYRLIVQQVSVERPLPDRRLDMTWRTFRNHLEPGEKETWTLHIQRPDGTTPTAVMTAALTDEALRAFGQNRWTFHTGLSRYVPFGQWSAPFWPHNPFFYDEADWKMLKAPILPSLLDLGKHWFDYASLSSRRLRNIRPMLGANQMYAMAQAEMSSADMALPMAKSAAAGKAKPQPEPYVRTDFSETAFFAPALYTDGQGNVDVSFTLPQSLTSWRFQAIAHDAEMRWAAIDTTVVAQKHFSVHPNLPRFVRSGDKTKISATISNLTARDIDGRATMVLTDATNGRVLARESAAFHAPADSSTTVSFNIQPNSEFLLTKCLIEASNSEFADGEAHYLPILSDRELATVATPFALTQPGTTEIRLQQSHSAPSTHHRLSIEASTNAMWYAVAALPALSTPATENVPDLVNAAYATGLARYLLDQHPAIATTLAATPDSAGGATTTWDNLLLRNPDLRQVLMAETPWFNEVASQSERLRRLQALLDTATIRLRWASWRDKLAARQLPNGSWSWFERMSGNVWTTLDVVETTARLQRMTGANLLSADGLQRAFNYLDSELQKRYSKKQATSIHLTGPDELILRYLYAGSLAAGNRSPQFRSLLAEWRKHTGELRTIDAKARAACVLFLNGYRKDGRQLLRSLEEMTVETPEMGRYFDTERAPLTSDSYRIPAQVATIEALVLDSANYDATISAMQQWLAQSRRMQGWGEGRVTAEAIYALLMSPLATTQWAQTNDEVLTIEVLHGEKVIDRVTARPERGDVAGHLRQDFADNHTAAEADGLRLHLKANRLVWGAAYEQYWLKSADATPDGKELTVERRLEVWRNGRWQPIQNAQVAVGEKIRQTCTITAGRDFDFVSLKLPRSSNMEPGIAHSGMTRNGMVWTYRAIGDTQTQYFIDHLPKGRTVITDEAFVDRAGSYVLPRAAVQCAYAPEFIGHSAAERLTAQP